MELIDCVFCAKKQCKSNGFLAEIEESETTFIDIYRDLSIFIVKFSLFFFFSFNQLFVSARDGAMEALPPNLRNTSFSWQKEVLRRKASACGKFAKILFVRLWFTIRSIGGFRGFGFDGQALALALLDRKEGKRCESWKRLTRKEFLNTNFPRAQSTRYWFSCACSASGYAGGYASGYAGRGTRGLVRVGGRGWGSLTLLF